MLVSVSGPFSSFDVVFFIKEGGSSSAPVKKFSKISTFQDSEKAKCEKGK